MRVELLNGVRLNDGDPGWTVGEVVELDDGVAEMLIQQGLGVEAPPEEERAE
jgi:hypothetical protein